MRKPVVAGRFYPATEKELLHLVETYINGRQPTPPIEACAVIVPHAGYVYSGVLAGKTLCSVQIPETVLLIGPNHTGQGSPVSLSTETWITPFGSVPVNTNLANRIVNEGKSIVVDEAAHANEHSLEVQLPFLQKLQQNLSIVPLTVAHLSYDNCEEIAEALYCSILQYGEKILIVASTDMSHYESRPVAEVKDKLALDTIIAMDPQALYSTVHKNKISMCGVIPVVITLLICKKMGTKTARLLDYMDSGTVSGDTDQVVGYAGVIIE
jgi:AmmeMemoRadiSam system protein B